MSWQTQAQSVSKTIVLVRHAEKMPVGDSDKGDPELSPEGRARAERFMRAVKRYRPSEIFVTDYKRTQQTAEPIARLRNRPVQVYDPSKPAELIAKIMPSRAKRYLVIGHSNTIPILANLLMKKEIFKNLLDSEYGVFWVIRLKKGTVTKVEVFSY